MPSVIIAAGDGGTGYQLVQVAGSLLILAAFAAAQAGKLPGVWAVVSLWSLVQLVRGRTPTAPGH